MNERGPRLAAWKVGALLLAFGLLVGTLVAVTATATGSGFCDHQRCWDLVMTLARRVGIVTTAAVVLMGLLVAGLMRMVQQDDRDRAERAMEAYRASRDGALQEK
jgi:hypothetical protein